MDSARYRQLLARARRLSSSPADAEDLVQETLVAALQAGRDDLPWLYGVLRRQAALQARTAARRRRREHAVAIDRVDTTDTTDTDAVPPPAIAAVLDGLPPAARRVAVLALHGLSADEIRWLLGLSATAFRQRLTSIRRKLAATAPASRSESLALAYLRDPARSADLQFGQIRRALKAAMPMGEGLGGHDLDGHLLLIRSPARGGAHTCDGGGNK